MATRFVVTQIKFCHQCGGTGILQHPAWKAYWKEHLKRLFVLNVTGKARLFLKLIFTRH